MSLEKKLKSAAVVAAREAALRERARVLWCLDEILRDTREGFKKSVLVEAHRQIAEVKLKIMAGMADMLKRRIIEGWAPPSAKLLELGECETCLNVATHWHNGVKMCKDCLEYELKEELEDEEVT